MLYDRRWEYKTTETKRLEPWQQLLLDAADYMEKHGHAKGSVQEKDGSVCLIGALSAAATGNPENFLNYFLKRKEDFTKNHPMIQAFLMMEKLVARYPISWNNDPHRPGKEVIDGMRACANA